jgi:hypothetical protein
MAKRNDLLQNLQTKVHEVTGEKLWNAKYLKDRDMSLLLDVFAAFEGDKPAPVPVSKETETKAPEQELQDLEAAVEAAFNEAENGKFPHAAGVIPEPVNIPSSAVTVVEEKKSGKPVCKCGKICASDFGLQAHARHCVVVHPELKDKKKTTSKVTRYPEGKKANSYKSYRKRSYDAKKQKVVSLNFRLKALHQAIEIAKKHSASCKKSGCLACAHNSNRVAMAEAMAN